MNESIYICYLLRKDRWAEKTVLIARKEGLQIITLQIKANKIVLAIPV